MSEKSPSRDEALEALDFIVNVLKEHEKDLDRLVNELGSVADQLGETGELNDKVIKIEDKISTLQSEVEVLVESLVKRSQQGSTQTILATDETSKPQAEPREINLNVANNPLLLECRHWEDFEQQAAHPQAVSFTFKENEKMFEVEAIKINRIITFKGETPSLGQMLKIFLGKRLILAEENILEGTITLT